LVRFLFSKHEITKHRKLDADGDASQLQHARRGFAMAIAMFSEIVKRLSFV